MKIYSLLLISLFFFTGCKEDVKCPAPFTIYKTNDVYIPVKQKRPNIECSLDTEDDMFDCIVLQKRIIEEITE